MVGGVEAGPVGEEEAEVRLHVAVLEGIVEEHDIGGLGLGLQPPQSGGAALAHRHLHAAAEAAEHLQGLVAHLARRARRTCAAVAAGKDGHAEAGGEEMAGEKFGVGGLSRAADGKIADAEGGHRGAVGGKQAEIEQTVAERDHERVEPG